MRVLFLGDWCHESSTELPALRHAELERNLSAADVVVANFEGPLACAEGRPIAKVGPHLAQSHAGINHLADWGVTHVSLANNHTLDSGDGGLRATVHGLETSGLRPFGYRTPEHGDCRVARLGEARIGGVALIAGAEREFTAEGEVAASSLDPIALHSALQAELEAGYSTIMVLHGGTEYQHQPPPHLRRLARWLLDCGASAVITHHPHVSGYVEEWRGKPIAWSLGDLWMPRSGASVSSWPARGYAVACSVSGTGNVRIDQLITYVIDYADNALRQPDAHELEEFTALQAHHLTIGQDDAAYAAWWSELVTARRATYMRKYASAPVPLTLWKRWFGLGTVYRRWLARCPQWTLRQLNGLRCESHRELWTAAMESIVETKRDQQRGQD